MFTELDRVPGPAQRLGPELKVGKRSLSLFIRMLSLGEVLVKGLHTWLTRLWPKRSIGRSFLPEKISPIPALLCMCVRERVSV